ncbi:o-succinylbenzoate synthase [Nocardia sp. CA-120079]|uniref:o-succinylbenzoate synthase n=1 Tax=Nocardia sp. CA-120079 TaxID=3239974 RepID=UPI003D960442
MKVRLEGVELRRLGLPLRSPFRTSFGVELWRDILLLRVVASDAEGWGECVALPSPSFSSEYIDGAADVIRRFLLPALAGRDLTPEDVAPTLARFRGHRMAKAALEMAILDAWLRSRRRSYAGYLGATRTSVAAGVSIGIMDEIPELLDTVTEYLEQGYQRIKLKIEPGWDIAPVRAVRERFGAALELQVDANGAYTSADADHLAGLDEFELEMLEQPLAEDRCRDHVMLARRLRTPICLDESILSARGAADAIEVGACSVVNIKAGRVGGYLEARSTHDVCAAHGAPAFCGGMLETGLGQAANLAVAALPGCTLPADIVASDRSYERDIIEPLRLEAGYIPVPDGHGLGVDPLPDVLKAATTSKEWLSPT